MHSNLILVELEGAEALVSVEFEPVFDGGTMLMRINAELVVVVEKEEVEWAA
jgi:hypothetical protein